MRFGRAGGAGAITSTRVSSAVTRHARSQSPSTSAAPGASTYAWHGRAAVGHARRRPRRPGRPDRALRRAPCRAAGAPWSRRRSARARGPRYLSLSPTNFATAAADLLLAAQLIAERLRVDRARRRIVRAEREIAIASSTIVPRAGGRRRRRQARARRRRARAPCSRTTRLRMARSEVARFVTCRAGRGERLGPRECDQSSVRTARRCVCMGSSFGGRGTSPSLRAYGAVFRTVKVKNGGRMANARRIDRSGPPPVHAAHPE